MALCYARHGGGDGIQRTGADGDWPYRIDQTAGISQMRAVRLDGLPPRVIPRRIGIEPMTPLKGIPAQVTP